MAGGHCRGDEINRLLDAAFHALHESGGDYAALLRDEMSPAAFVSFVRKTAARHPAGRAHELRAFPVARGPIEDIYPLTGMQQMMLVRLQQPASGTN